MALQLTNSYLADSTAIFKQYQALAERAMAQVRDEALFAVLDGESNSIALIVKHMAGNMRSRWTDFLTTDGEKPDRNRDSEFEDAPESREAMMAMWQEGWACLYQALESLRDEDMVRTVRIRGEEHSVMQAIHRQVAHYSYHAGQIVFLSKHLSSAHWTSLTVPRRGSQQFNQKVLAGEASQR
jgi:hypothetical protein